MLLALNLICEYDRFLITPRVSQNSNDTLEKIITSPLPSKSLWKLLIHITVSKPPLGLLFWTKLQWLLGEGISATKEVTTASKVIDHKTNYKLNNDSQ